MTGKVKSKKVKVGGLDIHYLSGGQGAPLLVIHGGSEGACAWRENIEELAENYTVYVPDLPGFGHSQPMTGDYYIPELIEFVDEFARNLGLEKFHLMGHSLGGGIALSYALKFPHKISKLVLVSSLFLGKDIALWMRFLTHRIILRPAWWLTKALFKAIKWVVKLLVTLLLVPVEFVAPVPIASVYLGGCVSNLKEQTTILVSRLSEVMAPTLVVWGARDPIVPVRHAYAAAYLIPDCQVKVFEDSGHSVYRENIPEFSRLLTGFLG